MSYKFAAEKAETKVTSIDVQVGKTGILTPVANFEPVQLAGTTVKRASLHNFDEIDRLDVRVGDIVVIEKAGEIIPQVIEVKKEHRPKDAKPFKPPVKCPQCGSKVEKDEDGVYIRCVSSSCPAQLKEKLRYFAGRDQMDIENLGESLIEQLVDKRLVKDFADLYKLNVNTLANLERMADKSAWNIIDGIEKSKTRPLWRLIAALGILNVGTETAKIVADKFVSLDKIRNATLKELVNQLSEFKEPALPKIIYEHMSSPINKELIQTAIDINKNQPLWMFIKDLHIKSIAEKKSRKLAENFKSIDDFLNTTVDIEKLRERLQKNPVIPKSIYDYFHNEQNLIVIDELLSTGVSPSAPQENSSAILANKTFVVTGSLASLTRSQVELLITDNGGKVSSSVSKNTSFVLAGKDAGTKLDKAQELNIKIINEDDFLKLIDKKIQPKKKCTLWD